MSTTSARDPEVERRAEAFSSEFYADKAWDSEFTASPYSPYGKMQELCDLGPEVAPVLRAYLASSDRELRSLGCYGFQLLGPRVGAPALAWLEPLLQDDWCGSSAAEAIAAIDLARFWTLGLQRFGSAVNAMLRRQLEGGGGHELLGRLVALDEEKPLLEALNAVDSFVTYGSKGPLDAALLVLVRKAMQSQHGPVRGRATYIVGKVPAASPVEALIEGMATSGQLASVERVAWSDDSLSLVRLAASQGNVATLADLLQRRRCAGLATDAEPLLAQVEATLRNPRREWRYEEHEVEAAARCAFELADVRLLPALVDAVVPANGGYAWNSLRLAHQVLGDEAVRALEARARVATGDVLQRVEWMLEACRKPVFDLLELGDGEFVRGSIDHSTGGAFGAYARALRFRPLAHAAFQLAWIDRAFGVPVTERRAAWIRGLGFSDEGLLEELRRPVTPIEGGRFAWRKCAQKDAARVAAAGLPGLAFSGSRDPAHRAAAEAHVARVKAACAG